MNIGLPVTPEEMVSQSVEAHAEGAAVIHIHARDPLSGRPSADVGLFREYCVGVKEKCDAVISITTGGATGQTIEERLAVIKALRPELATCNLGTMNYGLFQMIPRYEGRWKYDWEQPYLESTRHEPFVNRFSDIEYMLTELTEETGCRFEFEAYDVGHLYTLAYYADQGLVKPPIFMQFVVGTLGGIGPDIENVVAMKQTADRLFGTDIEWSVLGGGRFQFDIVTAGAVLGATSGSAWRMGSTSAGGGWPTTTPNRWPRWFASWGVVPPDRHLRRGPGDTGPQGPPQCGFLTVEPW